MEIVTDRDVSLDAPTCSARPLSFCFVSLDRGFPRRTRLSLEEFVRPTVHISGHRTAISVNDLPTDFIFSSDLDSSGVLKGRNVCC